MTRTCPRCDSPVLISHGEEWCLNHGTVSSPVYAHEGAFTTGGREVRRARRRERKIIYVECSICGQTVASYGRGNHEAAHRRRLEAMKA